MHAQLPRRCSRPMQQEEVRTMQSVHKKVLHQCTMAIRSLIVNSPIGRTDQCQAIGVGLVGILNGGHCITIFKHQFNAQHHVPAASIDMFCRASFLNLFVACNGDLQKITSMLARHLGLPTFPLSANPSATSWRAETSSASSLWTLGTSLDICYLTAEGQRSQR